MPRKPFDQRGANLNPKDAMPRYWKPKNENTKGHIFATMRGLNQDLINKPIKAASGVMEFGENSTLLKHLPKHILSFGTSKTIGFCISRPYLGQSLPLHFVSLSTFLHMFILNFVVITIISDLNSKPLIIILLFFVISY